MESKSEHSVCEVLGKIEDILNEWEASDPKKRSFRISDMPALYKTSPDDDAHSGIISILEYSD